MASGKIKWFDNKRGFGFIAGSSGKDVFVHHSAILGQGYKTLAQGEWVTYEIVDDGKGPKARKVQRLRPNSAREFERRPALPAAEPGPFPSTTAPPARRV